MKKLSESIWSDMEDRGTEDVIKNEDEYITNIKNLVPVDLGGSVLWADRDLELQDETVYFTFKDVADIKKGEWRLPTKKEANEIFSQKNLTHKSNGDYVIMNKLIFTPRGYVAGISDTKYDVGKYYSWTSTPTDEYGHSIGSRLYAITINGTVTHISTSMYGDNKICVRLVKDK